jgi:hypothetical protein
MTDADNIIAFTKGEVDAFGLPPEPPGHPSRAMLTGMRKRTLRRTLLLGTAVSLAIAGGLTVGAVAMWIAEPPRSPVTEIVARPVEQAPAELQAQLRAWWASRNAGPPQPHSAHR